MDKIKASEEYIANPHKQIHFIAGATWMEQIKNKEIEELKKEIEHLEKELYEWSKYES